MSHAARVRVTLAGVATVLALSVAHPFAQDPTSLPNPYNRIENFFKISDGRAFGAVTGIDVDKQGNVWVFDRCGANLCAGSSLPSILKFDASGKHVASYGANMFVSPHSIYVAPDGNLWVTDFMGPDGKDPARNGKGHQVFKMSPDGKVLMTLGKAGVAGTGNDEFNGPSAVVVAPNGDIFVADGHGGNTNARIVKFNRDGKFLKTWGEAGTGPGQFNTPHSLAIDSRGRLYVADRANNRIQIFDLEGKFLEEWKQFGRPSSVYIDGNDMLYVADSQSNEKNNPGFKMGIYIGSTKDGKVTAFVPDANPEGSGEEMVAVDAAGGMYGARVSGRGVTKYVKK